MALISLEVVPHQNSRSNGQFKGNTGAGHIKPHHQYAVVIYDFTLQIIFSAKIIHGSCFTNLDNADQKKVTM